MLLQITNLSKRFGNNWVLRDVSFEAGAGSVFGIFGPTASGKTTLLWDIAGKLKTNGGDISIDGKNLNAVKIKERGVKHHDGLAKPKPFGIFSVGSEKLSAGEEQLKAFEAALSFSEDVLLLDDPFRYLDKQNLNECFERVRSVARDDKKIVIVASSDFDHIAQIADEAAVLINGDILQSGTPQEIYDDPQNTAVARITGENNIFAARRLTSTNARLPEFQTIDGSHRIFTEPVEKVKLGAINQNVMLAIRPEQVSMSLGASFPEDNLLKAVVTGIKPLGPTSLIEFDAGGLKLSTRVFRVVGLDIGDECMIGLPPHRIQVLKD
jgi:ABC-type Fe3+/spermidine/putrescine transport system ATPase subunit